MDRINQELMERLMRLQWLLSRYFHRNLREHGSRGVPYSGQGRVLKLLKLQPEIAQKELTQILGMRSQSIGELLSKLEKKGYITRTPSTSDKRVIIVRLTEAGKNADDWEAGPAGPVDLFDCLSEEEQVQLSGLLGRIITDLENRSGGECPRRRRVRGFTDYGQSPDENPSGMNFDRTHLHDRFFHI